MPALKRFKTKYPGVYYVIGTTVVGDKPEKIYYIRYRKDGKLVEDKAGRQYQDDMTAARASQKRAQRIAGSELSNQERRAAERAQKEAENNKWTIDRLYEEYIKTRTGNKGLSTDKNRYEKYLKQAFSKKEPKELIPLDIDRLRLKLLKKLAPQTVKHVLNLLTWIINYGVKKNLCERLSFHIQKPTVNNIKTEDLNSEQLKRLLEAIEADSNTQIKNLMKMALYTGMRRGELFKLQWDHIDFERGFINIIDPKGGVDQKIPLNDSAREILENHPRPDFKVKGTKDQYFKSPYVFPGEYGGQRVTCQIGVNEIKKKAKLPAGFRPMHGLRHVYASMLASSGEVDMYTLQRLLTHKDPRMTQRYAHLRDETLNRASNLAGQLIDSAVASASEAQQSQSGDTE